MSKKLRCCLKKFTQLTKILHDRRSRRSRQIPSLAMCWWQSKSVYAMGKSETGSRVQQTATRTFRRGLRQSHWSTWNPAVKGCDWLRARQSKFDAGGSSQDSEPYSDLNCHLKADSDRSKCRQNQSIVRKWKWADPAVKVCILAYSTLHSRF